MTDSHDTRDQDERVLDPQDEGIVAEEEDAAAAEAAGIGGRVDPVSDDPAFEPLAEAGEGESEGFELAEQELQDHASHGDQRRFPGGLAPPPEEPGGAEYGEPDEEISED